MEIENQDLVVVLNHEGRGALRDLGIDTQSSPVLFHALEKDEHGIWVLDQREDHGIWVLDQREDGDHLVLVRWEHIRALDLARGGVKATGPIN
jgi:hypothetical protein